MTSPNMIGKPMTERTHMWATQPDFRASVVTEAATQPNEAYLKALQGMQDFLAGGQAHGLTQEAQAKSYDSFQQAVGDLMVRNAEVTVQPSESEPVGRAAMAETVTIETPTVAELGDMMLADVEVEDIPTDELMPEPAYAQ